LATGGGKTVIFCHIAQKTAERGKNVLILVHRVELLRQTSKALEKSGVYHGLINPRYTPDLNAPVQVASVQTLINRLSKINPPDLIIIDEAHHAIAGSWRKVIDYFPNAKILGVTATPERGDGKGLDNIFDSLVVGPQTADLIALGYLVKPIIYAPPKQLDLSHVKIVRGDYDKNEIGEIMDKPTITGSAVEHYSKFCSGVPAVVFCISVIHAENVAEQFRLAGYSAYSVDGSMDDDVRTRILNGLGNGTIQVVTSCDIISEGTDIPSITCAILLRPTQSTGLYIQQVGRALRLSEGKEHAIILDHVGNVKEHGFPDDIRDYSLEGKKKTKKAKKEQNENIKADQCESCYAMFEPAPICPYCKHPNEKMKQREIAEVEGNLERLEKEQQDENVRIEKAQARKSVGKARTLEDLLKIQKEKGYKNGWAHHIMKARGNKK
jgi:DNA repair protein RadD